MNHKQQKDAARAEAMEHMKSNAMQPRGGMSHEDHKERQMDGHDPTGILSDESYIRGMASDNPNRAALMKKHHLKDDPKNPGGYGSSGKNY